MRLWHLVAPRVALWQHSQLLTIRWEYGRRRHKLVRLPGESVPARTAADSLRTSHRNVCNRVRILVCVRVHKRKSPELALGGLASSAVAVSSCFFLCLMMIQTIECSYEQSNYTTIKYVCQARQAVVFFSGARAVPRLQKKSPPKSIFLLSSL